MRYFQFISAGLSILSVLIVAPAFAQTKDATQANVKRAQTYKGGTFNGQSVPAPKVDPKDVARKLAELKMQSEPMDQSSVVNPMASAPPLTDLFVNAVCSTNAGCEFIQAGQARTTLHHGGAEVYSITFELGYGDIPVAKMNTIQLPTPVETDHYCWNSAGTNLHTPCVAGETIAGFMKWWDVATDPTGFFTYQDTSTNSPWNTMSTSITIQ